MLSSTKKNNNGAMVDAYVDVPVFFVDGAVRHGPAKHYMPDVANHTGHSSKQANKENNI